jgi:hypothetical protein
MDGVRFPTWFASLSLNRQRLFYAISGSDGAPSSVMSQTIRSILEDSPHRCVYLTEDSARSRNI